MRVHCMHAAYMLSMCSAASFVIAQRHERPCDPVGVDGSLRRTHDDTAGQHFSIPVDIAASARRGRQDQENNGARSILMNCRICQLQPYSFSTLFLRIVYSIVYPTRGTQTMLLQSCNIR